MPYIALIIPYIFAVSDGKCGIEKDDQCFHEIRETLREPFVFIGDGEKVPENAGGMEFFFPDLLREEFIIRDDEELPRTLSGAVLSEDTDREHANEDDLSLCLADLDHIAHAVLRNHEEKCSNRQPYIPKCDNDGTGRNRQKIDSLIDGVDEYESQTHEDGYDTDHIDCLAFSVVFQVVLGVFWIGTAVVLGKYRFLEISLYPS